MLLAHTVLFKYMVSRALISLDAARKNYRPIMMIKVFSLQPLFRSATFLLKVRRRFSLLNIEFMDQSLSIVYKHSLQNNSMFNILLYAK